MAISIYLNGTAGAQDGTLEVTGDGIGAELYDIGSVATFFLCAEPNYKTSEPVTVYAPLDCEVSSDGITYGPTCTYAAGAIQDVNVPCYIKRVDMTQLPNEPRVETKLHTYPHCAYVSVIQINDITPPVLSGTLTATAGTAKIDLSWPTGTDEVGITGYDIEYGTSTSYGTALISTTNSKSITGLINAVPYYFRVRAFDANGNKSDWITSTATPLAVTDTFRSASLNTNIWAAQTAANGTITTGAGALINSPATTDGAILYRKTAIDRAANKTYKWKSKLNSSVANGNYLFFAVEDTDAPFAPNASNDTSKAHSLAYNADTNTLARARLMLVAQSNSAILFGRATNVAGATLRWFNPATNTWVASGQVYPAISADTWYVCEFSTNTLSQWRFRLLAADGTTVIFDTGWQNWSGITGFTNSPYLIIGGEPYTNVSIASAAIDWYDEV